MENGSSDEPRAIRPLASMQKSILLFPSPSPSFLQAVEMTMPPLEKSGNGEAEPTGPEEELPRLGPRSLQKFSFI